MFDNTEIWCICLESRDDRYKLAVNEFKKHNLTVKFHRPKKNSNAIVGCYLSHLFCFQESKKNNKHALVFEDDVKFNYSINSDLLKAINKFISTDKHWDILRLGTIITYLQKKYNNYIWQCKSHSSHAVLYNKNIKLPPIIHYSIDQFLFNSHLIEYTIIPNLCIQRASLSDIDWGDNMMQSILENKYIFEHVQNINNIQLTCLKNMPIWVQQYCGLWYLLSKIGNVLQSVKSMF
jgi:GR25 family glycosyltransferase involved in LPS biosynthesis